MAGDDEARKGMKARLRERDSAKSKGRRREGKLPSRIPWRRDVANRLKVQCRLGDVESCLVAISIINTMKNNRANERGGEDRTLEERLVLSKRLYFFLDDFLLSIIGSSVISID